MRSGRSLLLSAVALASLSACSSHGGQVLGQTPRPVLTTPSSAATSAPAARHQRSRQATRSPSPSARASTPRSGSTTPAPVTTRTAGRSTTPAPAPTKAPCASTGNSATLTMVNDASQAYQFSPRALSIKCGDRVTVTNNTVATHNWEPTQSGFRGSPDMGFHDTYSATFYYRGTYGFVCSYHPWMTGKVTVG